SAESDERTFRVADSGFAESPVPGPEGIFAIFVVDAETGRPVPLVEVASPHRVDETDNFGAVAFDDRDVLGTSAEFRFSAHGYRFAEPVRTLFAALGGSIVIPAVRTLAAERLYRIPGAGQYRHAVLLGLDSPMSHPLLNASVMGQDTALGVAFRERI